MVGDPLQTISEKLLQFGEEVMNHYHIYPYVSFVLKEKVIVSKGYNQERETGDITSQDGIVAIRIAQQSLDTGDLPGYTLFSMFEPTILMFDAALWAGIRDFAWCINSSTVPDHYNKLKYTPRDYVRNHPNKITIQAGIKEKEVLALVERAQTQKLYPHHLLFNFDA